MSRIPDQEKLYPTDSTEAFLGQYATFRLPGIGTRTITRENGTSFVQINTGFEGDKWFSRLCSHPLIETVRRMDEVMKEMPLAVPTNAYDKAAMIAQDEAIYIDPDNEPVAYQLLSNRADNLANLALQTDRETELSMKETLQNVRTSLVQLAIDDLLRKYSHKKTK